MVKNKEHFEILNMVGALVQGSHIVYTSGRHGGTYFNKDALYPHMNYIKWFCEGMAKNYAGAIIDAVVGPELGGIILSQHVAHYLANAAGRDVLSLYAEKRRDAAGGFHLTRGYDELVRGKKVLIVEDVLTTGASVRNVVAAVRECDGIVVGVAALCNRGKVTAEMLGDVPRLFSLLELDFESYAEEDCPLCRDNVPINTKVGKGREYLAKKSL